MRRFSTADTYEYYFKERFKNLKTMTSTFSIYKADDPEGKFKNKTYLDSVAYGYYSYNDIKEYFSNKDKEHNTVVYCNQLLVDIEAILKLRAVKGGKGILADFIGIPQSQLTYQNFSFESAEAIINKIDNRLRNMSIEGIRELKLYYNKVKEDE